MRKDDRLIFRKPKNKIEELLKHEILRRRLTAEVKKEKTFDHFMKRLDVLMPLQIILGIIACALMFFLMGWEKLFETLLSWVIGMTIIATIITGVLSKYHREK